MARKNLDADLALGFMLFWITVVVIGFIGYVLNIVHVVHALHNGFSGDVIIRGLGVVIPFLGAILGYIS